MFNKQLFKLLGKKQKCIYQITILQLVNLIVAVSISYAFVKLLEYKVGIMSIYMMLTIVVGIILRRSLSRQIALLQGSISDEVQMGLREDLIRKIEGNMGYIPGYSISSLSQLAIEGIEQLNLYYTTFLPQFFYAMTSPLILTVILARFSIWVAIIFLIAVPLIPMSIMAVSRYAKKVFAKYWNIYLNLGGDFLDKLNGLVDLTLFGADQKAGEKMDGNSEEFRRITMHVLIMQLYSTSIMDMVAYGGSAIGMALALYLFHTGAITSYTSVIFIILVGAEFFLPMRALGSAFHVSMNGTTAGKKILEILAMEDVENGNRETEGIHSIKMENAGYSYEDVSVLHGVNLEIKEPGVYGIVGHSGSGKSTLAKILCYQNVKYEGHVYIDDVEITDYDHSSLYDHLAYVSNSSHIFMGSIKDNFHYVCPELSEEDMWDALAKVSLKDFVEANGGLDFIFEERAHNVSGGQKQRFILAFYLHAHKDVYIFDEITSNIDVESEDIIRDVLYELGKNHIVLMITHRLVNVLHAKEILVLDEGKVLGLDTHQNLMETCTGYQALYEGKEMA